MATQGRPALRGPAPDGNLSVETVAAPPPGARMATIRGINFAVPRGEHVGIIGPSNE